MHLRTMVIWMAMLGLGWAGLEADEVYLRDGRVLDGEVISAPESAVVDLKAGSGTLVAIQHFDRAIVLRITYGISVRDQAIAGLRARRAALAGGGEASDWWALSVSARDSGDLIMAKECATETLARDRQHSEAAKALGLSRHNGIWMRANEAAVARGEIYFRDRWVTWGQRDAVLADEAKRHDEALAEQKVRDENRRIAAAQAALASGANQPYPETSLNIQNYQTPYVPLVGGYGFHSVYWQNAYSPVCGPCIGIHASGGGHNTSWSFTWGL